MLLVILECLLILCIAAMILGGCYALVVFCLTKENKFLFIFFATLAIAIVIEIGATALGVRL